MRYVIESVEYLQDSVNTYYVTVSFYEPGDGNVASSRNDFLIQLHPGHDEKRRIDEVIRTYWDNAVAKGWTGDRTNAHAFSRQQDDPRGLINRPDIQALVGVRQ